MTQALLFDFDGTIVDTESPGFRAWQEIYAEHGQELPLQRWVVCVGTIGGFDAVGELERLVGRRLDRAAIEAARWRRKLELVDAERLRPGVDAYLREARARGLRLGIVTSGPSEWVAEHLARLGRVDGWDCILCADHEQSIAKPDPHLYREALAWLGIGPEDAIAIEDSPNGIAAAKGAGLFCVAVPNPVTSELDLSAADLRVGSLAELSLRELLARARR